MSDYDRFQCRECHQLLPLSEFARNSLASRGHEAKCKTCRSRRKRAVIVAQRAGLIPPRQPRRNTTPTATGTAPEPRQECLSYATSIDWDGLALDLAESICNTIKERLS